MRQALIVRAPELRLRCACQLVDLYKTKQSGTQRLKAPCGCATACKTSRNLVLRCRLHEDFPHANKCNLLNLEILQLIQLSWGIEDFSSFSFPTPQVSGHPKAPKTFLGFLGPIAPIKTEAHPEFFKNTIESSQLVLTIFVNFCCFQTIIWLRQPPSSWCSPLKSCWATHLTRPPFSAGSTPVGSSSVLVGQLPLVVSKNPRFLVKSFKQHSIILLAQENRKIK